MQLSKLTNTTVHQADLNYPASLDIVLKDCYGTFLVNDFTTHQNHTEKQHGIYLIDSAIRNQLKQFVFSGLENVPTVMLDLIQ